MTFLEAPFSQPASRPSSSRLDVRADILDVRNDVVIGVHPGDDALAVDVGAISPDALPVLSSRLVAEGSCTIRSNLASMDGGIADHIDTKTLLSSSPRRST